MQRIVLPGTHHSTRSMRLKSWHLLQAIANSSFVCFICRNFIPSKILSSNIISYNVIHNANGIFKSWEFYRLCPFARNKQSVHIVSFLAGHARSRRSARHTTIPGVPKKSGTLHFRYFDIWKYSIFWYQIKHCLLKRMIPRSFDLAW